MSIRIKIKGNAHQLKRLNQVKLIFQPTLSRKVDSDKAQLKAKVLTAGSEISGTQQSGKTMNFPEYWDPMASSDFHESTEDNSVNLRSPGAEVPTNPRQMIVKRRNQVDKGQIRRPRRFSSLLTMWPTRADVATDSRIASLLDSLKLRERIDQFQSVIEKDSNELVKSWS